MDWLIKAWLHPECSLVPLLARTNLELFEIMGTLVVTEWSMRRTVQKLESALTGVWRSDDHIEISRMVLESCQC